MPDKCFIIKYGIIHIIHFSENIGNWSTDSEEDLYDKCGSPSNYFDSVQTPCKSSYDKYLRKLRKMRNKHEDDDSESESDSDDN